MLPLAGIGGRARTAFDRRNQHYTSQLDEYDYIRAFTRSSLMNIAQGDKIREFMIGLVNNLQGGQHANCIDLIGQHRRHSDLHPTLHGGYYR